MKISLAKITVTLLIILSLSSSYLITQQTINYLKQRGVTFGKMGENLGKVEIPETTCNVVDPTPILPEGKSASDFVARSGYLKMGKGNSAFGFIFWGAQAAQGNAENLKNYPTLIWLQGGPGGSSQFGDFTEMGPILVTGRDTFTYTYNEYSWNQKYNMIFIDNPIGTGLSQAEKITDIPRDQKQVATDLYNGLIELYTAENGCFNQLGLTETPLIISGESYAGKYVPSIAHHILEQSDDSIVKKALLKGGIAVGDGFTDPKTIMDTLPDFGYNLAMVNQNEREVAALNAKDGDELMLLGKWESAKQSFDLVLNGLVQSSGLQNVYNFADNQNGPEPLDLTKWLNQVSIKTGVFQFPESIKFSSQSMDVYIALSNEFMKYDVVSTVSKILKKGFPVLYYNGQNDVIVCTPCTEQWLDKVAYDGQKDFAGKQFQTWNTQINGKAKIAGYFKQSQNLLFATVNQAGHMVPTDQPEAASTLITSFVDYVTQRSASRNEMEFDNKYGMFNLPKKAEQTLITE